METRDSYVHTKNLGSRAWAKWHIGHLLKLVQMVWSLSFVCQLAHFPDKRWWHQPNVVETPKFPSACKTKNWTRSMWKRGLKRAYSKIWKLPSKLFFNIYALNITKPRTSPTSIINNMNWLPHREVANLSTFSANILKDPKARALYASSHILRLFALC